MAREVCPGTGYRTVDPVAYRGKSLARCAECLRVVTPRTDGTARVHGVRSRATASHDATMETVYAWSRPCEGCGAGAGELCLPGCLSEVTP